MPVIARKGLLMDGMPSVQLTCQMMISNNVNHVITNHEPDLAQYEGPSLNVRKPFSLGGRRVAHHSGLWCSSCACDVENDCCCSRGLLCICAVVVRVLQCFACLRLWRWVCNLVHNCEWGAYPALTGFTCYSTNACFSHEILSNSEPANSLKHSFWQSSSCASKPYPVRSHMHSVCVSQWRSTRLGVGATPFVQATGPIQTKGSSRDKRLRSNCSVPGVLWANLRERDWWISGCGDISVSV